MGRFLLHFCFAIFLGFLSPGFAAINECLGYQFLVSGDLLPAVLPEGRPVSSAKPHEKVGQGATGDVHTFKVKVGDGPEQIAVKKTLKPGGDDVEPLLDAAVRVYLLADALGLGPRVIGVAPKVSSPWFWGRDQHTREIYLEYQKGTTLFKMRWERNTLPETLAEARSRFGRFVIIQKAFDKTTEADWRAIRAKAELIRELHPDPSPENILLVERTRADGSVYLDVTAIDWEDGAGGSDMTSYANRLQRQLMSTRK